MRVAINGVGVAGPTLAWWLKRFGHEPVLFEQAPELRTGGYVIDFWGLGYDLAERMGILPVLKEKGYLIEELRMVNRVGKRVAGTDVKILRKLLNERILSIPRGEIASTIFHACQGVETHFGTSVVGVRQSAECVRVELSNSKEDRFDVLVGADGLHSRVRSIVFGDESHYEKPLGYYVAAFNLKGYPKRNDLTAVTHTLPQKQVMRVSLRDDVTVFLFICRAEKISSPPTNPEDQKKVIHEVFGDMGWEVPDILRRMDKLENIYFDRVSQIRMDRWTDGRVALVGDAAACASLLAGEGTGLGMTEAYVLAGELHRSEGNVASAFKNYEAKLRPFLAQKQKAALGFAGFFAPKSQVGLHLRDIATNLSNNRVLAKWFVGQTLRDNIDLPDYT